ncbi:MAG: NAD(P)-dependent dehydrogenase (short-subunit alcohol dehydrogenase family) [Bradymonadia bacterium]|jgi:NAD(P)-dependent dehydrogenase (short-subunit alcohol dehydrogenase family)
MRIHGELAVVTGAGSGIGRATAQALAERGARLAISDIDADRVTETTRLLGEACVDARPLDVGDRSAYAAYAEALIAAHGTPGVLVNNAGVGLAGSALDLPLEDWDWLLRVNLGGVIHGCHFLGAPMTTRGKGHIVNIASMLGFFPIADAVPYCTSKFAVLGLSESLRLELAPQGIGVSAICPGMIRTDIANASRTGQIDAALHASTVRAFERRGADPQTVARAVCRAIERDIAVQPVTSAAWAVWFLRRLAPRSTPAVARLIRWATVR